MTDKPERKVIPCTVCGNTDEHVPGCTGMMIIHDVPITARSRYTMAGGVDFMGSAPKPEPNEADRERVEEAWDRIWHKDCSHPSENNRLCHNCTMDRFAAELAEVRKERDEDWEMESAGTLGYLPQGPKNPGEFTGWLVDLVEAIKQDSLSPSPCGKKGHRKIDWVIPTGKFDEDGRCTLCGLDDREEVSWDEHECPAGFTQPYCTACERENLMVKALKFSRGAIEDAIRFKDGLVNLDGMPVLNMIADALGDKEEWRVQRNKRKVQQP